jgi:hypothetical protein
MSKVHRNWESAFHRFEAQLRFEVEGGFWLWDWNREVNRILWLDGPFCHLLKTEEPYLKLPCLRDSRRHKYPAREKDSNRQVGPEMGQDESLFEHNMF